MSDLLVHAGPTLVRAELLLEREGGAALVVVAVRTEAVLHSTTGTPGRVATVTLLRPALLGRLGGTRGGRLDLGGDTTGVGSTELINTLLLSHASWRGRGGAWSWR